MLRLKRKADELEAKNIMTLTNAFDERRIYFKKVRRVPNDSFILKKTLKTTLQFDSKKRKLVNVSDDSSLKKQKSTSFVYEYFERFDPKFEESDEDWDEEVYEVDSVEDLFDSYAPEENETDFDDEDSNAEGYYKNDYPDEDDFSSTSSRKSYDMTERFKELNLRWN
eukprot:augustus_masked-scaffold_27-processed-gene-0.5-mRNA-1 protein AED:1.00 eAED:1.00 QI:0/-1/0/0/-1/1/1/0/166